MSLCLETVLLAIIISNVLVLIYKEGLTTCDLDDPRLPVPERVIRGWFLAPLYDISPLLLRIYSKLAYPEMNIDRNVIIEYGKMILMS